MEQKRQDEIETKKFFLRQSELENERRSKLYTLIGWTYFSAIVLIGICYILYMTIGTNQIREIFQLNEDVLFALNMSVNAFIYSLPAFLVACLGSLTKMLLSQNSLKKAEYIKLLVGAGLIGVLTFLSLKSGILLDLIIEHKSSINLEEIDEKKIFYKMIVLCFLTGMFSTTLFLTIEEKVNSLANKIKHS
ncbi:hypothetical protein JZ784_04125 [Acinetobacter sp. CWB-B33]